MKLVATEWTDRDSGLKIVERASDNGKNISFAVVNRYGDVLNKDGNFENEPLPSCRDAEFLENCRFTTFEDAANALERCV